LKKGVASSTKMTVLQTWPRAIHSSLFSLGCAAGW